MVGKCAFAFKRWRVLLGKAKSALWEPNGLHLSLRIIKFLFHVEGVYDS